ncbi:MAG: alpha/beta hydrolase [Pseudomonadota bacterium]
MTERQHRFVSTDGIELFLREYPGPNDAPVVLCLPGLTRNSRDFVAISQRLARRYRVIAPDLRGRGYSEHDAEWRRYHPGTYVGDVWELLDHLAIERCAILGTSLGGLIAMLMANAQPERVTGIVLNDVGPEVAPEGLARIVQYVGLRPPVSTWAEAAAQCEDAYGVTLPEYGADDWLAFARQGYRENARGEPELDFDPNIGRALREVGGTLPDPWALFGSLTVPMLCLRGAISDILSVAILERMQAMQPTMMAVTIPDRGHVPQLTEPPSIDAIEAFLGGL